MNASSEIQNDNRSNHQENRKNKHQTKIYTIFAKASHVERTKQQFTSNASKFQITPETVTYLNQQQINNPRRQRIQWTKHSRIILRSSVETKLLSNSSPILESTNRKAKKKPKSSNRHRKSKSAHTTVLHIDSPSTVKVEGTNTKRNLITVDTSKARSNLDVVRMCIRELGWNECSYNTTVDSDIYWHASSFHEGNINFSFNSGRVNKFPGMNDLLRKVHLTRSLNNMRLLFPVEFDFYPKTWFLPEQNQQFKDDVRYLHQQEKEQNQSLTTFIVKPSDGSQGEGIYLLRDPANCLATNRPYVVQEYIDRPLLINGLKFDLRIYVLILNLYPLEIFLYDEGLVRFATIDYKPPSTENLHETYMHLTNYSLNKRSLNYKHTLDHQQTNGSKRKLSTVWTQLRDIFGDEKIEQTKFLIIEMINKTILAILPGLRVEYELELPVDRKPNISCFQIIGFDIILTDDFKPILLEVNANPSLRIDFDTTDETGKLIYQLSPIDEEIKKPLILETLKLALPKKKLHTLTRHAQLQVREELMSQHAEKVAQRRIEERSERIRSSRKTHFDLKLKPYFSRPFDRTEREFESPKERSTTAIGTSRSIDTKKQTIVRKTRPKEDENESESPIELTPEISSTVIKRPIFQSATSHREITTVDNSIQTLKSIYPSEYKEKYRHLLLLDKIAHIYIQFVVSLGHKTMTGVQFRSFVNTYGIIDEMITASSIDILYYQILRKWQQYVLHTPSTEIPFSAFIEAFSLLSQRKYPDAESLLESVTQLVNICVRKTANQPHSQRSTSHTRPNTKSVFPLFFDVFC